MKLTKELTIERILEIFSAENKIVNRLELSLMNSDRILEISKGQVTKPATIVRRWEQPVVDGLLCEKIFGPLKDRTCKCNRYMHIKEEGITCPECGVDIVSSKDRYNRFGHINLNALVINPLFHDAIRILLRLTMEEYDNVVYNGHNLYFTPADRSTLVIDNQSGKLSTEYSDNAIDMGIGVNAIKNILLKINLGLIRDKIIEKNKTANITGFSDYKSRYTLYLIEDMIDNQFNLIDVIMKRILVIPAGFRSEYWNGDTFVRDNLNTLYSLVVRRNNHLRKTAQIKVVTNYIMNRERGALQEAIDILYFGSTINKKECKGLVTLYSGKEGRLRKNLLGKRVDYSGRSVIVPGLQLKLGEIGVPYKIISELLKPFVVGYLRQHYAIGIKESERLWRHKDPRVFEALDVILEKYRIIANRQPTLHRQGMMSYKIVPVKGDAIQLHPCVTGPYNADFDGDQMALHLPFREDSIKETDYLMTPKNNMLLPLNSEPNILPTQEQIYGLYYLTKEPFEGNSKGIFRDPDEAILAYEMQKEYGNMTLHSYVTVRVNNKIVKNTIGRLIFFNKTSIYISEPLNKKIIKKLLSNIYDTWSKTKYAELIDILKDIGFEYATLSGVSFCMEDAFDPYCDEKRKELIGKTGRDAQAIIDEMKKHVAGIENNSAVEMSICGARGNVSQLSQLIATKGLQAKADGTIIETPVVNSLGEGLTPTEFFLTVYGARKSLADKKMSVGEAGFIAHKIAKGCRDIIIDDIDCGSKLGIMIPKSLSFGRTIIKDYGEHVLVRSPVTCLSKGICVKCYGLELGRRLLAQKGDAVGIIAAQALTEPATQMVLRTFHVGGVVETIQGHTKIAKRAGYVKIVDIIEGKTCLNNVINFYSENSMELTPRIQIINDSEIIQEEFIPVNSKLQVKDGQRVNADEVLYSGDVSNFDIASSLPDLKALYDNSTKIAAYLSPCNGVIESIKPNKKKPSLLTITISGRAIQVAKGLTLLVSIGDQVQKGDRLTTGNYDFNKLLEIGGLKLSSEKFIEQGLKIYNDNGIKVLPIHLEVVYRALTSYKMLIEGNEPGKIVSRDDTRLGIPIVIGITKLITFAGSMLKRASIGWVKSGFVNALTRHPYIGDCETDRIVLGTLPLVGSGTNPDYIKIFEEEIWKKQ